MGKPSSDSYPFTGWPIIDGLRFEWPKTKVEVNSDKAITIQVPFREFIFVCSVSARTLSLRGSMVAYEARVRNGQTEILYSQHESQSAAQMACEFATLRIIKMARLDK